MRALMAIESFRQLILDAQAMMDPDFAGKLAADVAATETDNADTGFEFGASTADSAGTEVKRDSGLSLPRRCGHPSRVDPFFTRPHRLHQSSGNRRLAGGLQPH